MRPTHSLWGWVIGIKHWLVLTSENFLMLHPGTATRIGRQEKTDKDFCPAAAASK